MNQKSQIAILTAAFVITLLLLFWKSDPKNFNNKETATSTSPTEARENQSPSKVATRPLDPRDLQQVSAHPLAISFGEKPDLASSEPATLLEILQFYRMEFGSFPAGQENRDIMNSLTGNNPKKLPVFPRDHSRIDAEGNLLDAWGKPFVFHPISSQYLEVRSCGPDREIFTTDDIVVPAPRAKNQ